MVCLLLLHSCLRVLLFVVARSDKKSSSFLTACLISCVLSVCRFPCWSLTSPLCQLSSLQKMEKQDPGSPSSLSPLCLCFNRIKLWYCAESELDIQVSLSMIPCLLYQLKYKFKICFSVTSQNAFC